MLDWMLEISPVSNFDLRRIEFYVVNWREIFTFNAVAFDLEYNNDNVIAYQYLYAVNMKLARICDDMVRWSIRSYEKRAFAVDVDVMRYVKRGVL